MTNVDNAVPDREHTTAEEVRAYYEARDRRVVERLWGIVDQLRDCVANVRSQNQRIAEVLERGES